MMDFELEMKTRFPRENAMWQAIRGSLRPDEASFTHFIEWLGVCPAGHELRPKRDGKRAPFRLTHFEWVPVGTPRRLDQALRADSETGLQAQINELRARIEALEHGAPPQAEAKAFCVIDRGGELVIEQRALPVTEPGFISDHKTRERAEAEIRALKGPS